jgi:hypothetical protein
MDDIKDRIRLRSIKPLVVQSEESKADVVGEAVAVDAD